MKQRPLVQTAGWMLHCRPRDKFVTDLAIKFKREALGSRILLDLCVVIVNNINACESEPDKSYVFLQL